MSANDRFSHILEALYAGLLDDDAWVRGLNTLNDCLSGAGISLISTNPSNGSVNRSDIARNDPRLLQEYCQHWLSQDARYIAGLTCTVGEPQTEAMLVRWKDFIQTPCFNEFLKPAGMPMFMATWLERRSDRGVFLGLQRAQPTGPVNEGDRQLMKRLVPHIRRIVSIKDKLAQTQVTSLALLETMDRLPFGVLMLADNREIVEASRVARELLSRRDGVHADHGVFGITSIASDRAFEQRIYADPATLPLEDVVLIAREYPLRSLSLLVVPIQASQQTWLCPQARWMVLLFDPEQQPVLVEQALQSALGISRAEALLVQRLTAGMSIADAANELQISLNTARSQLKAIFSKTGVNSQSQLMARVLRSPAAIIS